MISKKLLIGSLFATAALLTDAPTAVHADPITTSGVVCGNGTPGEANDFQRFVNAIQNANPTLPRLAICAVPRSPALPAGANPVFVFTGFDGQCTATSYTQTGAPTASANFAFAPTGSSITLTFPAALAPPSNYITLSCLLNPLGAIIGMTAAN